MVDVIWEMIEKIMKDANIIGEIEEVSEEKCVILVEWGDWKHQHILLDNLMCDNFNIASYDKVVTEDDESDCFSARHTFIFA